MTSLKNPEFVGGAEKDPECIICQYFLHLSAVVCSCRPDIFVCLQHVERLCECNPDQQCLLYRYTMAEQFLWAGHVMDPFEQWRRIWKAHRSGLKI